jgi:hypothetical protein
MIHNNEKQDLMFTVIRIVLGFLCLVFSLYFRTGLRTALGLAHLGSLGIAPPSLFSAQYENKLKTLFILWLFKNFKKNRVAANKNRLRPHG